MATMKVSEAREKLAEAIETAQVEPVYLERYGKRAAVIISADLYRRLIEALEDMEDVAASDAALVEGGESIPWDQVMTDLGWK